MNKQEFGKSTWDEETSNKRAGNRGAERAAFMRLENGSNVVRVITDPHVYLSHKYKDEADTSTNSFGEKIMCSAPLHKSCVLCDNKNQPKKRWFVGVIDRKSNQYKVLDISVSVYDGLKALNKDEDYGSPINYDIDIKVTRGAAPANYYNVIPKPPKPLSENDLAIKASHANEEDLARKCTPPTPEWVFSKLNTLREKKGLPPFETAVSASSSVVKTAVPVDMSNDDDDVTFPAVGQ